MLSCDIWGMLWRREMVAGVEVVFTRGSDADMYIIAEVKLAKAGGAPRVVVVSDDREINDALDYGNSMGWMPSEMYLHEMERVCSEQTPRSLPL